MLKLVIALIFGVLVLALLAGCGGEDDATTVKLTKAEFRTQADAICAKAERKRAAGISAATKKEELRIDRANEGSVEDLIVEVVLPVVRQMTGELAELGTPDAKAAAIVAAYESSLRGTDDQPRLFVRRGLDPLANARSLALVYGLKVCSRI